MNSSFWDSTSSQDHRQKPFKASLRAASLSLILSARYRYAFAEGRFNVIQRTLGVAVRRRDPGRRLTPSGERGRRRSSSFVVVRRPPGNHAPLVHELDGIVAQRASGPSGPLLTRAPGMLNSLGQCHQKGAATGKLPMAARSERRASYRERRDVPSYLRSCSATGSRSPSRAVRMASTIACAQASVVALVTR